MKKTLLLTSILAAFFVATFTISCDKKTDPKTPTCPDFVGQDTGFHKIYKGPLEAPLDPIRDSLSVTKTGDNTISVRSDVLKADLPGSIDATNCNKIKLDSFISDDTIRVPSDAFGEVKIWNVRAGGSGEYKDGKVSTSIKVAKGKTNIGVLGLDNLDGKGLELKGTFTPLR